MAREVNLFTSGWKATGTNVSVPQYELVVRFEWTAHDGTKHTGTRTIRFPNVLSQLPADYVKEKMTQMLIDYARNDLGVDA